MEAYCSKCRHGREMRDPAEATTASGRAVVTGACNSCETRMVRMTEDGILFDSKTERPEEGTIQEQLLRGFIAWKNEGIKLKEKAKGLLRREPSTEFDFVGRFTPGISYAKADPILKAIKHYTLEDVEKFVAELDPMFVTSVTGKDGGKGGQYTYTIKDRPFKEAGVFISAAVNYVIAQDDTVTLNLKQKLDCIGYRLPWGTVNVNGPVWTGTLGFQRKGGVIILNGKRWDGYLQSNPTGLHGPYDGLDHLEPQGWEPKEGFPLRSSWDI